MKRPEQHQAGSGKPGMRLIVHMGLHKTGSTYLQHIMNDHHEVFLSEGVYYEKQSGYPAHHFAAWDMGSAFVYQCPSCDDGSKWLTDTTGTHARSGMLAMLIGDHDPLGTSDAAFL